MLFGNSWNHFVNGNFPDPQHSGRNEANVFHVFTLTRTLLPVSHTILIKAHYLALNRNTYKHISHSQLATFPIPHSINELYPSLPVPPASVLVRDVSQNHTTQQWTRAAHPGQPCCSGLVARLCAVAALCSPNTPSYDTVLCCGKSAYMLYCTLGPHQINRDSGIVLLLHCQRLVVYVTLT